MCEHVAGPLASLPFTCCIEARRRRTERAPEPRPAFALVLAIFAESLQSPEERTLEKNFEKPKKLSKGKQRKREGEGAERTGALCSNGSSAKKQRTKNRPNREEK